ncbi:hypothetical protein [Noviherbaspirillum aridicola]|uniref:AAA domain-containing protein n=1 Tax=Noviherbaspirillum aridicola TaxID=2849687 RepID=A0ABQ4Q8F2_9BURK|nr:hypothetical protein [Noviherbaspirillum aridicola]GIZ53090.1 hypothetical protein NCCP691_31040 [Noviherbaspirillum aridicola]
MSVDHWHFPRPVLAQEYIASFERGLSAARGLFARRRMGKTEFLCKDLIPAAESAGYQAAYINLWDNQDDPGSALVAALQQAASPKGVSKVLADLRRPVRKLKAGARLPGLGEGTLEADLGTEPGAPIPLLTQAMQQLDKKRKKLLLVIDEAQVLAGKKNSVFAHALRAALDIRKDFIKVIFAGSSETTLRSMFARPSEPFYNWAGLEPFQLLGYEFVQAMVHKVNEVTRKPLSMEDATHAFQELRNTPEFFRRFLNQYLANPLAGAASALDTVKQQVYGDQDFERQWQELLPADRAVLEMIAMGGKDLFGSEARTRMAAILGLDEPVKRSTPQNALSRLMNKNLVTRLEHGRYQFEDESFADWVRHRDT